MRRHLIMTGWRIFELLALASFLLAFFVRNYYPSTTTAFSCPPLLVTESVLLKRNNLLDSSEHRKPSNEKKDISETAERLKHIRQVSTHPTTVTENEEDRRPIIWVEGLQRSGTTLMRVLLDTDPSINCGPEPMFFWSFFNYLHHVMHGMKISQLDYRESYVTENMMLAGLNGFINSFLRTRSEGAPIWCVKELGVLEHADLVVKANPNSRFILMLRDGRAFVQPTDDKGSPTKVVVNATFDREIGDWSAHVEAKWRQCVQLGIHNYDSLKREKLKANVADAGSTPAVTPRCMPVYYESLVQEPEKWMRRVYDFVGLPFNRDVLRHQEFINKRIRLSRNEEERNKQVKRPIYKSHVSSWFGPLRAAIPDALERSRVHAPMLAVLGYTQPAATSSPKVAERVMGNSGEEEVFDKRYSQLERNYLKLMDIWSWSNGTVSQALQEIVKHKNDLF